MPRGKNYVNNNRGVFLQSVKNKKRAPSMEACFYGAACTRKGCIYRHDKPQTSDQHQKQQSRSTEPCMAFLAGVCILPAETCRKRHPSSKKEREDLIASFSRIPCRYGSSCMTKCCLYRHAPDFEEPNSIGMPAVDQNPEAYPKDRSLAYTTPVGGGVPSAWQPSPPRSMEMMATTNNVQQPAASAWKPAPGITSTTNSVHQPATSAWKPSSGMVATTRQPIISAWKPAPPTSSVIKQQQQQQRTSQPQLNAQAKEFKPSWGS